MEGRKLSDGSEENIILRENKGWMGWGDNKDTRNKIETNMYATIWQIETIRTVLPKFDWFSTQVTKIP